MPEGRRRRELLASAVGVLGTAFTGPILPFDSPAAGHYADILATRRRLGLPMEVEDAMIAAITRANGAVLATRNIKHFEECGIVLHDPWQSD